MREIKILTVPFDPRTRIFDDEALGWYLKLREVLRDEWMNTGASVAA